MELLISSLSTGTLINWYNIREVNKEDTIYEYHSEYVKLMVQ